MLTGLLLPLTLPRPVKGLLFRLSLPRRWPGGWAAGHRGAREDGRAGRVEPGEHARHVGPRVYESLQGQQLFRPSDLRHWLSLVGIFEVGVHQDGTRMKEQDYPLEECSAGAP